MIYFTFVGNHDEIKGTDHFGAVFNIFKEYKDEVSEVFIFVSPSTPKADYQKIASQNKQLISSLKPSVNVDIVKIDLINPIDYDIVFPKLLDSVSSIIITNRLEDESKLINITSGTPTMSTCWILLSASELITKCKLVQSFEKEFARKGEKTTREVDFNIDDFPQIKKPSDIKRKLTIAARENTKLKSILNIEKLNKKVPNLIGTSKKILEVKDQILFDVDSNSHVLIVGERGTGKEVVADAIWKLHHRKDDVKLQKFDCGSFSDNLIQSELFGHVKGAFTGADKPREGLLKKCENKSIFLDEIGNLSKESQSKLLRVLSTGEIRKLGADFVETIDIQILAATNKDVNDEKLFAQDVKDRFHEVIIIPPLRDRKEDIPILVEHFIGVYSEKYILSSPIILNNDVIEALINDDWAENVRGLQKWVERVIRRNKEGGKITLENLPSNHISRFQKDSKESIQLPKLPLSIPIEEYILMIQNEARKISGGNMSEVDRLLMQKPGTEKQRQYRKRKP